MANVGCIGTTTIAGRHGIADKCVVQKQLMKVLDFYNSDLMQSLKNLTKKQGKKMQQENMDSTTLELQAN